MILPKTLLLTFVSLMLATTASAEAIKAAEAKAMSDLASRCIHQQYPNSVKHKFTGPQDVRSPKAMHPAFYGCLDWHSSVHGHWLLVRLLKTQNMANADALIEQLDISFTEANLVAELAYFNRANTGTSYERPYGLAWYLQLMTELRQWPHPKAKVWLQTLEPLENKIVSNISQWLPKLAYPIRAGEHSQTAFAFGLMLDWADSRKDQPFTKLVKQRSLDYYGKDKSCPLAYEPSGQDFLSPCLAEADLMRRVLSEKDYAQWLQNFLPGIPKNGKASWLQVARVTDRSDGKLAHLDGLNLSRAWMLEGIASALPTNDRRRKAVSAAATAHRQAALPVVMGDLHYMGSHWLGSFATYLLTERGLENAD